jgi:hypothetical protein
MECFMSFYEPLFYAYRVDFVDQRPRACAVCFHDCFLALPPRRHPMYDYQKDKLRPMCYAVPSAIGGRRRGPLPQLRGRPCAGLHQRDRTAIANFNG